MTTNQRNKLIWLAVLTLVWPLIQVIVFGFYQDSWFLMRILHSWPFLLMGFVSGVVLLLLMDQAEHTSIKMLTLLAYIIGSPFALFLGVLVNRWWSSYLGSALVGAVVLILFTLVGYGFAKKSRSSR